VDELVVTELILDDCFTNLDPARVAALLTCLFPQGRGTDRTPPKDALTTSFQQLRKVILRVADTTLECGLPLDRQKYTQEFTPVMMWVTYRWASGAPFPEICKLTQQFEGSIIRILRRLYELLLQLVIAAKTIGNEALHVKFTKAAELIHRGVPFAASLYTAA
jgi:ATP-dependent RNA helicase DOB1